MTKEEILRHCDELDAEAVELRAENDAIVHMMSLVQSDCSSHMDEMMHEAQRRQSALNIRVTKWEAKIRALNAEVSRIGFAAA